MQIRCGFRRTPVSARIFLPAVCLVLALAMHRPAEALQTEQVGPTMDKTAAQIWWPAGMVELAKHPTRCYSRMGDFQEWIYFAASQEQVEELIQLFAAADLRDHRVRVEAGPVSADGFDKTGYPYSVMLEIPDSASLAQLQPDKNWGEASLVVYVSGDGGAPPLTLPKNVTVSSTVPAYASPQSSVPGSFPAVDTSNLTGKVLCGYQGWFTAEGDGMDMGWNHWRGRDGFKPGSCTIDLWPDMSELDEDEKYATPFQHADGSTAYVFSSANRKTVLRHFRWMADFGIDGAFVQRFTNDIRHEKGLNFRDTVLRHCREGAQAAGRGYAVMYDLSGMQAGQMDAGMDDWKHLVDDLGMARGADHAYLHHDGKPVVAVWGVGFNDDRKYTLDECAALVDFLKNDPVYGGNTVMLGIPAYWRTQTRDTVNDPKLHDILLLADILSPWAVGRYRTPEQADTYATETLTADIAWCAARGKTLLPVVFPGFSWHNLKPDSEPNQIPRLGGAFLWNQYVNAKQAGATMVYQAMFDEVDEGTAIFKCTNDPPVGESPFITYEGLPSDHYLWLAGQGGRLLRGEIPATETLRRGN